MERIVINAETGDVIGYIGDGDRIVRLESMESASSKSDMVELNKGEAFVKVYIKAIPELMAAGLKGAEYMAVLQLLPYVSYGSGLVASFGRPMGVSDFAKVLQCTERNASYTIKKLVDKKVLARTRAGEEVKYFANPYIFMRGQKINKTLQTMFRKSPWARIYGG